jgi:AcrR family transcriptional regulator
VPALAPEERRAALIEATIPLLHKHGLEVSTRQIAIAAGVAEGTIFGVFTTKSSLVVCSILKALDPQPTLDALDAIDRSAPLRDRLVRATDLMHGRFSENAELMSIARTLLASPDVDPQTRHHMMSGRERMHASLTDVIEPDAAHLRRSPATVARLLLLYCAASTFGPFGEPDGFSSADMVSLLLDGLMKRNDHRGDQSTC